MKSKRKNAFTVLLVIVLMLCSIGTGVVLLKNNSGSAEAVEHIIEISETEGKLSDSQLKSLNSGAIIKYNDEIYQLSQTGEENVYTYTDGENIFVRKYIAVNFDDGFYRSWSQLNDEYVTKALLGNVLGNYATDSDVNDALRSALTTYIKNADLTAILSDYAKNAEVQAALTQALTAYIKDSDLTTILSDYAKDTEVQAALTQALENYMKSADIQKLLTSTLASYVKSTDGQGLVQHTRLSVGENLTIENNCMYVVYCFDESYNLAPFYFVDGSKAGKKGQFAIVFKGGAGSGSLTLFSTGSSSLVTGLAGSASGVTTISASGSSDSHLEYFRLGGKTL